ncbi:MAG: hypothetical protein AAFN40_21985 [Cyanobacteria bacterium J06560_6]
MTVLWDAIPLHTSVGIASRKRPAIALVHLGAGLDVFGLRINELSTDVVHEVFELYARLDLANGVTQLFIEQVKKKPQVVPFT